MRSKKPMTHTPEEILAELRALLLGLFIALRKGRTAAALIVLLALTGVACTQNAAEATKDTVGAALDATKSGANKAIDATKAAGDKTADTTKGAVVATGNAVTDTWITGKLKAKFSDETVLKGSDITIKTAAHVVTLTGTVGSNTAKVRAGEIAAGTEGVTGVVNHLLTK